jgi:hypothetical protein
MIVTYVLNSKANRTEEGYCHIVNNPLGNEISFCLPVLVIKYDKNAKDIKFHIKIID